MQSSESSVQIIGMIGVKREVSSATGAALSVIGGGADPGSSIPTGMDPDYVVEFSQAHEQAGFDMTLIGYASTIADPLLVAAHAAAHTKTLGYLLAHRPGFVAPTLAARKFATLDHITGGRIAMHVITGGSATEQRKDGDFLDHDERYRRTDEYLRIMKRVWTSAEPFDHEGEFYRFEGAFSDVKPLQQPHVPVSFGGASEPALRIGSELSDVYALWGEPRDSIKGQIARIRGMASKHGRSPRFSLSVRPILGATEAEAWDRARAILDSVKASVSDDVGNGRSARPQSVGSRRLIDIAAEGEIHDERLYMPIAYASGAPGSTTALVGTAEQVSESMLAYYDLGCTSFIIRGFDPLNDTIEYGRELIPLIREGVRKRATASKPW